MSRTLPIYAYLIIATLAIVLYVPCINNAFVYDDIDLIPKRILVKNFDITNILREVQYNFYRPLPSLCYAILYKLFGLHTWPYHAFNVLMHILAASAMITLIYRFFRDRLMALLAGIIFVCHPVQVETVAYIADLGDLLVVFFILLSFLLYIISSEKVKNTLPLAGMVLAYALALFSKESSYIFPALLLAYHFAFKKSIAKIPFFCVLGSLGVFMILRCFLFFSVTNALLTWTDISQRFQYSFAAIIGYIKLFFFPFDLHLGYSRKDLGFTDALVLAGLIFVTFLLLLAYHKKDKPLIFFPIAWFFITFLPVSNLYPIPFYMADHYLYLLSIGIIIPIATAFSSFIRNKRMGFAGMTVFVVVVLFLSGLTVIQTLYFRNNLVFLKRTVRYEPTSAKFRNLLGGYYLDMGRAMDAMSEFQEAIRIDPGFPFPYINLGVAYASIGKIDAAIASYKKAITILPNFAGTYCNLANAIAEKGDTEAALILFKKAIALNPHDPSFYFNMSLCLEKAGRKQEAINVIKQGIAITPEPAQLYLLLSIQEYNEKEYENSNASLKKAESLGIAIPEVLRRRSGP